MGDKKESKLDPNTELFQQRTFMDKEENCKKLWKNNWSWIIDEQKYEIFLSVGSPFEHFLCIVYTSTGNATIVSSNVIPERKLYSAIFRRLDSELHAAKKEIMGEEIPPPKDPRSLKPVPRTTTGEVGWLAVRPEFQHNYDMSWRTNIPIRAPDTWHAPGYGLDH